MSKDIVLIEWLDSAGTERWEFIDELEPILPHTCYSMGILFTDEKDYKTLVSSISKTQVLARLTIPTCSIRSIKKIGTLKENYG